MKNKGAAERLKQHDETALEVIINTYTPYVSTIIYNVTKGSLSVADMEEVSADVFITLWKNSQKVNDETLKGYLAAIAKSRAKDKLRTVIPKSNTEDIDEFILADEHELTDEVDMKILSDDLGQSLDKLGEPDREIVIRYYYYYQSTGKISEILGINVETIKTKLKKLLKERGY